MIGRKNEDENEIDRSQLSNGIFVTEHEHKKINFQVNFSDFNSHFRCAFHYYYCSNMALNF